MDETRESAVMTAEAITAPVIRLQLAGVERELRFDNRAAMLAEQYWREMLGRRLSYMFILGELDMMTIGGISAVTYGAMASAVMHRNRYRARQETVVSPAVFAQDVPMTDLWVNRQAIAEAVKKTLPAPKNGDGDGAAPTTD